MSVRPPSFWANSWASARTYEAATPSREKDVRAITSLLMLNLGVEEEEEEGGGGGGVAATVQHTS